MFFALEYVSLNCFVVDDGHCLLKKTVYIKRLVSCEVLLVRFNKTGTAIRELQTHPASAMSNEIQNLGAKRKLTVPSSSTLAFGLCICALQGFCGDQGCSAISCQLAFATLLREDVANSNRAHNPLLSLILWDILGHFNLQCLSIDHGLLPRVLKMSRLCRCS
jgi:hypothetical protein